MRERERDANDIVSLPLLYAKGDKYLDFFSVLAGRKDCFKDSDFLSFFFF